jgi:ATP-dependent DNA helicase Q1
LRLNGIVPYCGGWGDGRPDYKKLSILRQLFPRVPILALSATCPPKVLKDLLLTLRMKPAIDGCGE